jgi:hypothetical protein
MNKRIAKLNQRVFGLGWPLYWIVICNDNHLHGDRYDALADLTKRHKERNESKARNECQ